MTRGDFTADLRLLWISAVAICVGALCAGVAVVLMWLIALCTNLSYYQRISLVFSSPADNHLGWFAIFIPVIGGLIIGVMARYGSEKIRGHGIPEALEAILIGRSRMQPKVAVLKPVSSAISIGTGGPFGAEGPIIMTGGAIGSIIAQSFHMTAVERKTLLVAGAAGGMAATFATPVAAVLLAVELLLFEFKPRSLIPVALASFVAAMIRPYIFHMPDGSPGFGPLFAVVPHGPLSLVTLITSVAVGLIAGMLSLLLTRAVYATEDAFAHVPLHWMWWPAIGGLVVGIGGMIQPHALGVGYDNIEHMLKGDYVAKALIGLMIVKAVIWAVALGSGTSGGVLAPLLIAGGAMGAVETLFLPGGDKALWPLVSMAAVLGGTMRAPLTGVIFALELTHDVNALPALLIAGVVSYGFTVLVMKRSILTEKVARRGYHVSQEYSIDPLEMVSVGDVMTSEIITVPADTAVHQLITDYFFAPDDQRHQSYPVLDKAGELLGIVTRSGLLKQWVAESLGEKASTAAPIIAADLIERAPITAHAWESARLAAERMASARVERILVVDPTNPKKLVGMVTRSDLLKPLETSAELEAKRERFFAPLPSRS